MIESTGFVSSEERMRTKRFDKVINATNCAINALTRAQTFPVDNLNQFSQRVNGYFLPNISHGVIEIPSKHMSSSDTPFLVVNGDEKLQLGSSFVDQTPRQREVAIEQYSKHGYSGIDHDQHASLLASSKKYHNTPLPLPLLDPSTAARTESRYWVLKDSQGKEIAITGRPLVRFRSAIAPIAIASMVRHEDTHIIQRHNAAFYEEALAEDRLIERELEAYYDQWRFNLALIEADCDFYGAINDETNAASRAALVRLNSPSDPYAASDAVKRAQKAQNIRL